MEKFQWHTRKHELYRENDSYIDDLLHDLATLSFGFASTSNHIVKFNLIYKNKIIHFSEPITAGTQLKFSMQFTSQDKILFKPSRFPKEQQKLPNHFYFSDFEMPEAEIASFHLDR